MTAGWRRRGAVEAARPPRDEQVAARGDQEIVPGARGRIPLRRVRPAGRARGALAAALGLVGPGGIALLSVLGTGGIVPEGARAAASDASPAAAAATSPKKALKEARSALARGDEKEALRLYEIVLDGDPLPGDRRSEALYGAATIRLGPDPELRDMGEGRKDLEELLAVYPDHPRTREARLALVLSREADAARSEAEERRYDLTRSASDCAAQKADLGASVRAAEEEAAALRAESQKLKSETKSLRTEIQTLKSEIEKRDESLKKVKDALVGSKGRR